MARTCGNCKQEIPEGASFCVVCGRKAPSETVAARGNVWLPVIIIAAALVVAAAILLPSFLKPQMAHMAIQVVAPDYSDGDSDVPLLVEGQTSAGASFHSVVYVDKDGGGLDLEPGEYTVSLAASPLCESGDLYEAESAVPVTVTREACSSGKAVSCDAVRLRHVPTGQASEEQVKAAYDAALDSGYDASHAAELRDKTLLEVQSDTAGVSREKAFRDKLSELVEKWGYPEVRHAGGDYISGLAYARLVDFGDGEDRLVVSYYDPSGDRSSSAPGGSLESYPVEVWECDANSGLRLAHAGVSQLEGQNDYCSAILLAKGKDGRTGLSEREGVWTGPSQSYTETLYGVGEKGEFGPIASLHTEASFSKEGSRYAYEIDGADALPEEMEAFRKDWYGDVSRVYLTKLAKTDRNLQETIGQTEETLKALGLEVRSDSGGAAAGSTASTGSTASSGGATSTSGVASASSATSASSTGSTASVGGTSAAAQEGILIETDYYIIDIPSTWAFADQVEYRVNEEISMNPGDLGIGCETIISIGDATVTIAAFTDNWGPQGDFIVREIGPVPAHPGWKAHVFTPRTGGKTDAEYLDDIASFVTPAK